MASWRTAAALAVALSTMATAQVAPLRIRVVEGEAGRHVSGTRSARPLTVVVTDETGNPVRGAAVSFHLPEEGPSGLFFNGLRTEVAATDERGRAAPRGIRWNRVPGALQIRIAASKEQARAHIVSQQYVTESGGSVKRQPRGGAAP